MTQRELVMGMLRRAGSAGVTPMQALRPPSEGGAGSMRLAAVIYDLQGELPPNLEIVNLGFTTPNGKHVARYVLRERVLPQGQVQSTLGL